MLDLLADHPDAASRSCQVGHLVASAVVLDPTGTRVLLTRHPAHGLWIELGGHLEPDDATVAAAALREALEESGIPDLYLDPIPVDPEVFPRRLPTRPTEPPLRRPVSGYRTRRQPTHARSDESLDLAWFDITDLPAPLGLAVRRSIHRATLHRHAR